MSLVVREAESGDAKAVMRVHLAAVELGRDAYDGAVIDAWAGDPDPADYAIESPEPYVVVAERAGEVVGFGELRPEADDYLETDVEGEVRAVYVHPDAAREGVGTAIYRDLERRARELGVDSLGLWASLNAVEFYESLGFVRVGERTHEFGGEVEAPAIEMRKDLG